MRVRGSVAVAACACALAACAQSGGGPAAPEQRRVISIDVRPHRSRLALLPDGGARRHRQLAAVLHDGRGQPVEGRAVVWSSDSSTVQVDTGGMVTLAGLSGPGRVWASSEGVAGSAAVCPVVWENDFEDEAPGPLTRASLAAGWNSPPFIWGLDRASIVSGPEAFGGGKSLRVAYPRGSLGPDQGGAIWTVPLGGSYDELYASFSVRFGPGFDFVQGGKLPGLAGGEQNTGGRRPNGRDGWSVRGMWVTGGRLIQYVYHPDQNGEYGEGMIWVGNGRVSYAVPDRWYHIEYRVAMNTPGQRDGIIQAWVDGVQVLDRRNLRFRDVGTFAIDGFQFSTFFGGDQPAWAAHRDEVAYFDNFVVSTFRMGPAGALAAPECQPDPEG